MKVNWNPLIEALAMIVKVVGIGLGFIFVLWVAEKAGVPMGLVGTWLDKIPSPW